MLDCLLSKSEPSSEIHKSIASIKLTRHETKFTIEEIGVIFISRKDRWSFLVFN